MAIYFKLINCKNHFLNHASFIVLILGLFVTKTNTFNYHRLRPGCEFLTVEDWVIPQVLILNAEKTKIITPGFNDSVYLPPSEEIVLACPHSTLQFNNVSTSESGTTAKCNRGTSINIQGNNIDLKAVSCAELPKSSTRVVGKCFNLSHVIEIEIGFDIGSNFIKIMNICFNNKTLSTIYSHFNLTSKIIGRQKTSRPKSFDPARYYQGIEISYHYSRNKQRTTIEKILGSRDLAVKYIPFSTKSNYFLSRGHLTAKADFIYAAEQHATFYYINVAPQWQVINGNNWASLEESVRKYAITYDLELQVYTLPYGTLELPDTNGTLKQIYLYHDENSNSEEEQHKIRVPKFYIKLVYNEKEKTGTAFVSINNPFLDEITEDYQLCNDICDKYKWLQWNATIIERGYSYCCSYNELKDKIVDGSLPELPITDILTE